MGDTAGRGSTHGRYRRTGVTRRTAATAAALVLTTGLALGGCGAAGNGARNASAVNGSAPQAGADGAVRYAPQAAAGAPAGSGNAASGSSGDGAGDGKTPVGSIVPSDPSGRSIIYTGEIQLRTRGTGGANGVDAAVARAEQLVTTTGGFIDSEVSGSDGLLSKVYDSQQPPASDAVPGDSSNDSSNPSDGSGTDVPAPLPEPSAVSGESAQLVLRIPVASYDSVYQQLLKLGTVLAHQRQAQDVTQQVVDVSSRVKTQQASVARVRALMDRAKTIADVTTLEGDLTQREADLESLESQLSALNSQTAMSTVTVQLYAKAVPPRPVVHHEKSGLSVLGALKDGWHALYETGRGLLIALTALLPFLVPVGVLLWLARLLLRRRTLPALAGPKPKPEPAPEPED
jgi:hypothetical protein